MRFKALMKNSLRYIFLVPMIFVVALCILIRLYNISYIENSISSEYMYFYFDYDCIPKIYYIIMCALGIFSYSRIFKIATVNNVKKSETFCTMILSGLLMSLLILGAKIVDILIFISKYKMTLIDTAMRYLEHDDFFYTFINYYPDNLDEFWVQTLVLSLIIYFLFSFFCYILCQSFIALLNCYYNTGRIAVIGSYLIVFSLFAMIVNNGTTQPQLVTLMKNHSPYGLAIIFLSACIIICTTLTYIGLKKAPLKISKGA